MVTTLDLSNGFRLVDGDESVRLRLEQHLRFIAGEWPLNTAEGVSYWGFLGRNRDLRRVGLYLATEMARVADVQDVTVVSITNTDGVLTGNFTVRTFNTTLNISVNLNTA